MFDVLTFRKHLSFYQLPIFFFVLTLEFDKVILNSQSQVVKAKRLICSDQKGCKKEIVLCFIRNKQYCLLSMFIV